MPVAGDAALLGMPVSSVEESDFKNLDRGRIADAAGVLLSWLARRAGDDRVRGFTANEESLKVLLLASRMSPDGSTASECSRSSWADRMPVAGDAALLRMPVPSVE